MADHYFKLVPFGGDDKLEDLAVPLVLAYDTAEALRIDNPFFVDRSKSSTRSRDVGPRLCRIRPCHGVRPDCGAPGTEPKMATADGSPTQYVVYEVKPKTEQHESQ